MKVQFQYLLVLIVILPGLCLAEMRIGGSIVDFATVDQAKKILSARDDYILRQSPFDRAVRMKTDKPIEQKEYLKFLADCALPWTDMEKQKIEPVVEDLREPLEKLSLPFPKKILLIKTSGREEGDAPHTRSNAVIFPQNSLNKEFGSLKQLLCHEIFHVLTRANPKIRERLYPIIGFLPCDEVKLPDSLNARRITNPDAPFNNHCIQVKFDEQTVWAIPILLSNRDQYDPALGGGMFNYMQCKLLLVDRIPDSNDIRILYNGDQPRLADFHQVSGLMEQVGMNTFYLIGPEEILADNFVKIILPGKRIPSPEILNKIKNVLGQFMIDEKTTPD